MRARRGEFEQRAVTASVWLRDVLRNGEGGGTNDAHAAPQDLSPGGHDTVAFLEAVTVALAGEHHMIVLPEDTYVGGRAVARAVEAVVAPSCVSAVWHADASADPEQMWRALASGGTGFEAGRNSTAAGPSSSGTPAGSGVGGLAADGSRRPLPTSTFYGTSHRHHHHHHHSHVRGRSGNVPSISVAEAGTSTGASGAVPGSGAGGDSIDGKSGRGKANAADLGGGEVRLANVFVVVGLDRATEEVQVALWETLAVGRLALGDYEYLLPKPFIVIAIVGGKDEPTLQRFAGARTTQRGADVGRHLGDGYAVASREATTDQTRRKRRFGTRASAAVPLVEPAAVADRDAEAVDSRVSGRQHGRGKRPGRKSTSRLAESGVAADWVDHWEELSADSAGPGDSDHVRADQSPRDRTDDATDLPASSSTSDEDGRPPPRPGLKAVVPQLVNAFALSVTVGPAFALAGPLDPREVEALPHSRPPAVLYDLMPGFQAGWADVYVEHDIRQYVKTLVVTLRNHPGVSSFIAPQAVTDAMAVVRLLAVLDGRDFATPTHAQRAAVVVLVHRTQARASAPEQLVLETLREIEPPI